MRYKCAPLLRWDDEILSSRLRAEGICSYWRRRLKWQLSRFVSARYTTRYYNIAFNCEIWIERRSFNLIEFFRPWQRASGSEEKGEKSLPYPPFNQSIVWGWKRTSEKREKEWRNLNLLQGFPTSFLMLLLTGWLRAIVCVSRELSFIRRAQWKKTLKLSSH